MAFDPSTAQLDSAFDPDTATESPAPGFKAGDYLKGLKRGVLGVPGALTGLADIPIALVTGERVAGPVADALGKVTGFQPSKWAKETGETFSPGAKAAQAKIEEAWKGSGADRLGNALLGNFDDLPAAWQDADLAAAGKAIVENPGASALQVVESLPAMLAGGAIGKGVAVASKLAPAIAGAIGEGAITAGQQMDQTDAAVDPRRAAATSATAGALTGAIAGGMGRVAQKLGLEDIQTTMAGGKANATGLGRAGRLAGGAASEALQEIPQSAQEQVWQNVAEEKPLGEGVVRSAVEGGIAGGVMGAGANLRRPGTPLPPPGATAPGDVAEMDALNAGLTQAGNDYAGLPPPNAGLLEEKPILVQNPVTGRVTEIDRRGGPLEQAAAQAVESGATEAAQNIDAAEVLFPYATTRAAQDYVGQQADPEMYDVIPHPRVQGRSAAVPKTGPARQAILDKRAATGANEQARLRGEQLKLDESPAPTEVTESIAGAFGNGATGTVTITPQRGGGFEVRVSSSDGATKRSNVAAFPAGTNRAKAIAAATRVQGGFTKDKPVVKAKPAVDTAVADVAQDELAPPPVQRVADMPGVQQRAKAQAAGAVAAAQTRTAQLADEETIDTQAQAANTQPTDAQKEAGNYAHGHITVGGLDISVETPAGATRSGVNKGKRWSVKNTAHYGYVKRSTGADGEQVDVYVKPGTSPAHEGMVFVVDQYDPETGRFDEHKALLGYGTQAEAAKAYDAHFNDRSGAKRRGAVTSMTTEAFKTWLKNGATDKPVSPTRFNGETSDTAQAVQDEIARSTGKMSLPRSAQKPGESDAAFELRRAAATQAAKTARTAQQALPTKQGDQAEVRAALRVPDDAPVSILTAASRPDADQAKGVSKQAAQFIEQVARTFGKRVVFFDVPDRGAAEGFYVRGNTVFLNVNSGTQHLRVLGHELTHAMKRQAPDAYAKMLGAVAELRTDEEMAAQHADYFGEPLKDAEQLDQPHPGSNGTLREFLAEEWMADLSGNRFAEPEFWTALFGRLEGQHGAPAAKGIIAKLRLALVAALNKLKTLIGGNAFAVDARLGEHLEGVRQAISEGFSEYARLSKAGLLADAAGEAKFKQPGSDIGHKRESDGRYVGAPEWVGDSPQQLAVLRKKLLQLTLEGEPGRFWYEQSSKAILELAKGDKSEAEKIVQLIALYSPSAQVPGNTTQALKAYYQWKQGQPVRVGFGQADRKANALLYEGKEWKGMKTNTFYSNLMEEIDPSKNLDGATMDMWMAIAFDYGSKALDQGPKYKFAERETQRIAKRLGWSPHQVQAAIWTALKGRVDPIRGELTAQELDNGWYDEESQAWWASGEKAKYESRRDAALRDRAAGKRTPFARVGVGTEKLQPARRKDHYHLAHRLGMEYNLTPEDVTASKYDFSNAIKERTAQMSWEATPGETTGVLPGIHKAPMHQQQEYLVAIRKALSDEKGNDLIGKEVGLALATSVQGFGGWQGVSTVGIQDGIAIPIDTATSAVQQTAIDAINLVADIKGLVLYQEGVAWHFPHYKGSKNGQNGVEFRIGRLLTEEENANLYKGLVTALGHTYAPPIPTQDGQGFRVLNFPDEKFALMDDFGKSPEDQKRKTDLQKAQLEKNVAFIEAVRKTVFKQPWHAEVTDEARFESIGELRENDWSKGDGDYRGRIAEANGRWPQTQGRWAGRSDILEWVEHDLRPRVAEVNRDFSERYGWGKASLSPRRGTGPDAASDRRNRGNAEAGLRRQVQPESVSAVGVHYSKQPRERLDSSYFGTGISGAEVERVAGATDPRIKQRIYFYVNNGRPIKPEEGVGSHAHQAQLDNLYDYVSDPLDLRVTNTAAGFESALLDKGFDGAINHERGIAVLLGPRSVDVEYIGQNDRPDVPQAAQAEPSTYGKQLRAVAANRGLPSGEMTGADWKRLMPKLMPDIDVSHLDDAQKYYKDEVVKRPQALAKMSTQREGLPEGFRVAANPISEGRKFIVTDANGVRLGSGETREEAIARFKEVHAALYPVVPDSPASPSTLDGAKLKALRRAAAGLERPQTGVFLHVTEDGKAVATGPKGARIPNTFRRFAHENGLSFYAQRRLPNYSDRRTAAHMNIGITPTSGAMPIAYRESGAKYFGESAGEPLDRTDKTRFSPRRVSADQLSRVDVTTFGWHEQDDEYAYHVTSEPAAARALKEGLVPGKKSMFPVAYAAHSRGRVFFTERSGVKFWEGRIENALFDQYDDPPAVAVLRAAKSGLTLETDDIGTRDSKHGASFVQFSPQRRQTRTPEFKVWFGDWEDPLAFSSKSKKPAVSVAVDEKGAPLVLYHATNADFSAFETGRTTTNSGLFGPEETTRHAIFAAPDVSFAQEYLRSKEGGNVMPVYMAIKSPMDLRNNGAWDYVDDLEAAGFKNTRWPNMPDTQMWEMFDGDNGLAFVTAAKQAGYDGAILFEVDKDDKAREVYVAFDARQIKSAIGNRGTFSPASDDLRYSPPRFFSQLARVVENAPAKLQTQPAAQWKLWLAGQQTVKKDELTWSGLNDWLDLQGKAKVSRAQIQEYLEHNGVKLGEKVKGHSSETQRLRNRMSDLEDEIEMLRDNYPGDPGNPVDEEDDLDDLRTEHENRIADMDAELYRLQDQLDLSEASYDTTFSDYQEPGGTDYRELLITLPVKPAKLPAADEAQKRLDESGIDAPFRDGAQQQIDRMRREGTARATFQSSHFDEPNILAHLRFNSRTDVNGEPVMFLEEIQSDWAEQGRSKGFKGPQGVAFDPTTWLDFIHQVRADYATLLLDRQGIPRDTAFRIAANAYERDAARAVGREDEFNALAAHRDASRVQRIAPGPFVQDTKAWTGLALKRAVMWAVQNGFTKVAWTTGAQQAERYDLSKQINRIKLFDAGADFRGKYRVTAYSTEGRVVLDNYYPAKEELAGTIGKDLAERLLAVKADRFGVKEISGIDIKTGGEGMHAYYGAIVPQVANELLRKVGGGKVGTVEIAGAMSGPGGTTSAQPGFTITPEMAAKVAGEGLPMFSRVRKVGEVSIIENPTRQQARVLLDRSEYKELRGLQDPETGKLWIWDAAKLLHDQAASGLGLSDDYFARLRRQTDGHGHGLLNIKYLGEGDYDYPIFSGERKTDASFSPQRARNELTQWAQDAISGRQVKVPVQGVLLASSPALKTGGIFRPIVIDFEHARHILNTHPEVTAQDIGALPELLPRPRVLFRRPAGWRAILDARDPAGQPLAVALTNDTLKLGKEVAKITEISTLFGMENSAGNLARELLAGNVAYMPRKEVARLVDLLDASQSSRDLRSGPRLPLQEKSPSLPTNPLAERNVTIPSDNGNVNIKLPVNAPALLKGVMFSTSRANLGALSPAQAAAANNVLGTPKTFLQRLAEFRKDWAKNLKQGIFDQFAPIAELDPQAYMLARLSKGGESTLEALMLYGKLHVGADGATDVRYTRAGGTQGFAGKMAGLKGEHDRFLLWVAAQRADRLQAIGLENLWTPQDIAELKQLDQGAMQDGTARPALYAQALQDLNEFNDNVLEVAVSSGLIDDATRQMYAGTPYVPFYRLQEDDEVSGFGIKPGLVNQYAWKRLKGGTQKLNEDLLANLLHNWSHLITASAKNRAAKATLDAAAANGIAAQIPAGAPGKGHVSYKTAGQEQVFVVSDPHLFDAVAALHYAGLGPWAKPLAAAKHWLTIGVTANPAFKVRNLIRDSISALGSAQLSYNVAGNLSQGWQATAKESETRAHLLASGGMIRFGSMLDGKDSQRAKDLIHEGVAPEMILDNDAKIKKFWKRYVHPALSAYNEFGDRTENINRAALYEQLIAKGLTNAEAAYWSRDLMDFAMAGKWTAIRTLTQTVPFFNARLQGLYKLGRAGKQDIRRLGTVLGAVSLASLALLLAYDDDDDWKKRSDSDRNNYWWFKVGGHAFRLPKPFEIGAVGTLAERGYELLFDKEMTDARFGRNMRDIVMSQLSMNPVPQLFKPMMDIYANKDAFTGQAIESMGMERLRKQDRYDEKTSEVARFLGSLGLPDPTQFVMGRWDTLSPKQIDFLARGYFSWLGTMTTTALDYGIRPMLERGERPAMQLKDVFFAGNFVESLPSNQSRYLTQMYDQAREIEQAYASYRHMLKIGDVEGAKAAREEDGTLIRRYASTEQLKRAESMLNQQLQRINASTTLSGEEKRVRLDQVYARRNTLAEQFRAN